MCVSHKVSDHQFVPNSAKPQKIYSQGIYAAALKQFSLWPGQLHDMIQILFRSLSQYKQKLRGLTHLKDL